MRILSFSKKWEKLGQIEFTTFRFPRKDRDWSESEQVQIVYKARSKDRELLGVALIKEKEAKTIRTITEDEAIADGFSNGVFMWLYLGKPPMTREINKLTLRWTVR